jgi:methionyl-tRNA synthetase
MLLSKEANRYFDDAQPWATRKSDPQRCASSLYVCCQFVRAFAGLWAMILPFSMQQLWDAMSLDDDLWQTGWPRSDRWLAEGHPVSSPGILFQKIDEASIAPEKERLDHLREQMRNETS